MKGTLGALLLSIFPESSGLVVLLVKRCLVHQKVAGSSHHWHACGRHQFRSLLSLSLNISLSEDLNFVFLS